jgi:hypothetical protein
VRFDTRVFLMIDRADGQIALELLEGLLDLGQLDIVLPQASGMLESGMPLCAAAGAPTGAYASAKCSAANRLGSNMIVTSNVR